MLSVPPDIAAEPAVTLSTWSKREQGRVSVESMMN